MSLKEVIGPGGGITVILEADNPEVSRPRTRFPQTPKSQGSFCYW